jgi:hypothetical protein
MPRVSRRLAVAALLCAVASLVAGCGRDEASTATVAGERLPAIEITEPGHQREYRAAREGNSLSRRFDVRGTAAPGRLVSVVARCQVGRCAAEVKPDDDGRWATRLAITTSTFQPSVKVTASYADDPAAGDPATVEITLREPERPKRSTTTSTTADDRARETREPSGGGRDPRPTGPASSTDRPVGGARAPTRLTMIGDSLAEGTQPYLEGFLPGWTVTTDARRGRTLGQGMALLRDAPLGAGPHVLAFSLFTNDGPGSVATLDAAVRESARRAGSGGCAIWATIVRPPVGGVSYDAANARLRQLGATLEAVRIVDWASWVRRNPDWMAGDGVHATPEGYRSRARLYAELARTCAA